MLNAKIRPVRLLSGFALLLLLGACASSDRPQLPDNITDAGRQTEKNVGDPDLKQKLVLQNVRSRRTPDEVLQVEFEIYNRTSFGVDFEWAVLWLDASDFRIEAPLEFQQVSLDRKSSDTFFIEAPSSLATGFQLRVEKPRS